MSGLIKKFTYTKGCDIPKGREPFLIEGILHRSQTLLYGQTITGKSMLALSMAIAVSSGRNWCGQTVTACGRVMIVTGDPDGINETCERLQRADSDLADNSFGIDIYAPQRPLIRETWFEIQRETENHALVVVDNLTQFVPGSLNDDAAVKCVYTELDSVNRNGVATLIVAHTSEKRGEFGYSNVPLGSSAIRTGPRWFIHGYRKPGELRLNMSGNGGGEWELVVSEPGAAPRFDVISAAGADELSERRNARRRSREKDTLNRNAEIFSFVTSGHSQREAAEKFGVSTGTVNNAIRALKKGTV